MSNVPPRPHFLTVARARLRILEWQSTAPTTLVLVHGFNGFGMTWDRISATLRGQRRLLAPELRGHGESGWDPDGSYYAERYLADLIAIVDHFGLERFDLLGHSLGALICVLFAARHPERIGRLILDDASPRPEAVLARMAQQAVEPPLTFPSWSAAAATARPEWTELPSEVIQYRLRHRLATRPDGTIGWRNDVAGLFAARRRAIDPLFSDGQWELLARLPGPTLFIRGERSTVVNPDVAQRMAAVSPGMRLFELEGAGHYGHREQPAAYAREVASFLAQPVD
jgi:pimeloyl-ACP methyl ester carboxylesterase